MTYDEVRKYINDGDIVFLKTNTFVGKIIRFFTGSPFTHVCIAFWMRTEPDRLLAVEAQGGTTRRIINMSMYSIYDFEVVEAPRKWTDMSEDALSKLGIAKYGWGDAIYLGIRQFLLQKLRIKLPRRSLKGEICSEFVATMIGMRETSVTPSELYSMLIQDGHEVKYRITNR